MSGQNQLYDIYILRTTGLPILAGCTTSEYCKTHMKQHELQSGFLSAIHAFSRETFTDSQLYQMRYDDIQLSFKIDDRVILAMVHSIQSQNSIILNQLNQTWALFHDKYGQYIDSLGVPEKLFEDIRHDLEETGVITTPFMSTFDQQLIDEQKHKSYRAKLLLWQKIMNKKPLPRLLG